MPNPIIIQPDGSLMLGKTKSYKHYERCRSPPLRSLSSEWFESDLEWQKTWRGSYCKCSECLKFVKD